MPEGIMRVFQALNGDEVKEILLREIRSALDSDPRMEHHLSFPVIDYEWEIRLKPYPYDEKIIEKAGRGDISVALKNQRVETLSLKGGRRVDAPDQARVEAGLPVSAPQPRSGITVDADFDAALSKGR